MNYITLEKEQGFNVLQTLSCGQVFRFGQISDNTFWLILKNIKIFLEQIDSSVKIYPSEELQKFDWRYYFDLDTNYKEIQETLSQDDVLKKAVEFGKGIRILNQDKWECLLSFIISQNNNIPRIKKIIERLSAKFGSDCGGFFAFPTPEQLKDATIDDFAECGTGFRAKYIKDLTNRVLSGEIDFERLGKLSSEELITALKTVYGVGDKVANCAALFAFGRRELYPIDVWVKRATENFFFAGEEKTLPEIKKFAEERFSKFGGYAQQYLFNYERNSR